MLLPINSSVIMATIRATCQWLVSMWVWLISPSGDSVCSAHMPIKWTHKMAVPAVRLMAYLKN